MAIAVFALFMTGPAWAQRGGGGHAGFSGGHGGGFSGHAAFSGGHGGGGLAGGMRSGAGFSRGVSSASRSTSSRNPYLHDGFHGNHFHQGFHNRFRTYGFRNKCYGYRCGGYGYPWGYYGYYDPWWWNSDSSYDEDDERDRAIANDMNEQSLEEQQMFRQEQADGDRDVYARSDPSHSLRGPRPAPSSQPQGTPIMPATVLVFRDQHQKEIQNYAIVGQTLWNFAPQHTEKIPLADLDLVATVKSNDDRGITFRVPASNEAQ